MTSASAKAEKGGKDLRTGCFPEVVEGDRSQEVRCLADLGGAGNHERRLAVGGVMDRGAAEDGQLPVVGASWRTGCRVDLIERVEVIRHSFGDAGPAFGSEMVEGVSQDLVQPSPLLSYL
ncbi:hypothetical protein ACFC18_29135 [Streptomyces sp. NPDC056121]|uniref:hypothetical protein n=1 Tax=Streptomyces sp. NPDC056121 TaxID=3345718 RepID=UPI0035DAE1A7